jgi:hypothetical protein
MGDSATIRHHLLKRALVVWLILIAAEFIHSTLRVVFLVPIVGDWHSRQAGSKRHIFEGHRSKAGALPL